MADPQFDAYRALLALSKQHKVKKAYHAAIFAAGLAPGVSEKDMPHCGYYRILNEDTGALDRVAIYMDGDDLVVTVNDREARLTSVWPKAMWLPIEYSWYLNHKKTGQWPDEDEAVAMLREPDLDWRESGEAPPAGHNAPPEPVLDPDSALGVAELVQRAKRNVSKYAKITSDEMRDAAQSLRSVFLDLALKADKKRKALVEPHVAAQRAINGEWNPVIEDARAQAKAIEAAQSAWANEKASKRREEEAAAAAAQRAAEEAARAANAPPPPPPAPIPAPAPTSFRGGTGRVAKEVEVKEIDDVDDWMALFAHYQNHEAVRDQLLKLASRDLRTLGFVAPGVRTKTVMKVA